jgi:hypothetical protein
LVLEMKRMGSALSETLVVVHAVAILTIGLMGSGCVGLDKPPEVAKCSSAGEVCLNGGQHDSGVSQGGRSGADGGFDLGLGGAAGAAGGSGGGGSPGTGGSSAGAQDAGSQDDGLEAGPGIGGASGGDGSVTTTMDTASAPDVPLDGVAGAVDVAGTPPVDALAIGGVDASVADLALVSDVGGKDTVSGTDVRPAPDGTVSVIATVTFNQGLAIGPMTGYGWVTLGSADSVTSPTCGTGSPTITSANPCLKGTIWNTPSALCVTGLVPALPPVPTAADYTANWGLQVGVNAKEPNAATGRSFSTITINFSAAPVGDLRVELHRSGDAPGATYCFAGAVSGLAIPIGSFNTKCWDGTGTALTAADGPTVDSIGLQVTSGSAAITVTNLCLNSIVFGS